MSSLNGHLPQEEVDKVPKLDDEIVLGDEFAAPLKTQEEKMDENSPTRLIIPSRDEEEAMSSGEASSMPNEPTLQPLSQEIELTSDSGDESEEMDTSMDTSTTVRRVHSNSNRARRSIGIRHGMNYARQARNWSHPICEQGYYLITHSPVAVTGHEIDGFSQEILYYVTWRNGREDRLIQSSILRDYRPDLIIDYWENKIIGSS